MARPTVWRRAVVTPGTGQDVFRERLALVAPGETVTRVLMNMFLISGGVPTQSISSVWFAGLYAVDPESPEPLPDPRSADPYPWLWWGLLRSRMFYDDPTTTPGQASTTELTEPYEGAVDVHGQRRADTPGGLEVHFVAANQHPVTGGQALLRLSASTLILLVA